MLAARVRFWQAVGHLPRRPARCCDMWLPPFSTDGVAAAAVMRYVAAAVGIVHSFYTRGQSHPPSVMAAAQAAVRASSSARASAVVPVVRAALQPGASLGDSMHVDDHLDSFSTTTDDTSYYSMDD